jgi:hypothetical protein
MEISPVWRTTRTFVAKPDFTHPNSFEMLDNLKEPPTPNFQMNYQKGNLFDLSGTSSNVHCITGDFLTLKGFAEQVRERFGRNTYLKELGKVTGEVATQPVDD